MGSFKAQPLNDYVTMLNGIYGRTQNYALSASELHVHLTEVTGAFGKFLFKRGNWPEAVRFLPRIFAWSIALFSKVAGERGDLERAILIKFPGVCPYCVQAPCKCREGLTKGDIDETQLRAEYYRNEQALGNRSLNDYQKMFREIYRSSWGFDDASQGSVIALASLGALYGRLVEELSELAEALRFVHIYPSNFDNEIADFMAWWFAVVSCCYLCGPMGTDMVLAEDIVWSSYPARCPVCMLAICDCRPGPVREILSKPGLFELDKIDHLTQTYNKASYEAHIMDVKTGAVPFPVPFACIWIDIDGFKRINDEFSHSVGDAALRYVVSTIRQKVPARNRVHRFGGDEFTISCPDLSGQEAVGLMSRVQIALSSRKFVALMDKGSRTQELDITLSIGVAECGETHLIEYAFSKADEAAASAKQMGKNRISLVRVSEGHA